MGGLVRYGVPWRLGADEATTLSTPVAVRFGDLALAAGRYSLYAVPAATQWEIVVNASAERWGVPIGAPVRARDVGSVTVAPDSTDRPVEQLVLRLEPGPAGGLVLVAEWERTRIRVPIELQ
jgi:hypothetical protein